jgi:hypothetical protein
MDPDFASLERSQSAKRTDQMSGLLQWNEEANTDRGQMGNTLDQARRDNMALREKSADKRREEGAGMHQSLQWKGEDGSPFKERQDAKLLAESQNYRQLERNRGLSPDDQRARNYGGSMAGLMNDPEQ